MEMIIISAPSEFIVLPPHPLTKDTQQTFTLKLGYMWSSQSFINKLENLGVEEIARKYYYVIFQVQEDFFLSQLKEMQIYYDSYYENRRPRMADLYCITFSREEYDEMIHAILANCPKNVLLSSSDWGSYYELWDFRAVILKRIDGEDLEEIRNLGVSILTLLGRK